MRESLALMSIALAAYAKAVGLDSSEVTQLYALVMAGQLPITPDQAWTVLEEATLVIRRDRQPPVEQAPVPWSQQ